MSIGDEVVTVADWLEAVLADVPDITGVYDGLAPDDAEYPFIVFDLGTNDDLYGVGPERIWNDGTYTVRGVSAADDFDDLRGIAAAIDQRLHGASGTTSDGVVIGARRLEQYRLVEQYENEEIRHLGGQYRVLAQGT